MLKKKGSKLPPDDEMMKDPEENLRFGKQKDMPIVIQKEIQ